MHGTLHVLLVEDNPDDADLILLAINKANGYKIEHERVETEDAFKKALHRRIWNAIVCDFSLPQFSGKRAVELLQGYGITAPVFMVSGKITEEDARAILGHRSIISFVTKGRLSDFGALFLREVDLSKDYEQLVQGYSRALVLRDLETAEHSERVTAMSVNLARFMGISEIEISHIERGAILHDVGKLGIRDSVLLKPGKLDDGEMYHMRQHPKHAYDLLMPIQYLKHSLEIPYCHHENFDGSGYPRGLKGEEIPLAARIFSVVDVYDALTENRPYRSAWTVEKTIEYIREKAGTLFDPKVVDEFVRMVTA